ncbi:MAG: hypothetical protein ACR2QX_02315 [Woeseiaceae bacterium]
MAIKHEIPWIRIGAESAAIVASILLAFAIDAWWDERVAAEREQEILKTLLADFESSREQFEDWKAFHLAVQASNTKLLQLATSGSTDLTNDEIDRLLLDLSWWDIQSHFATSALNSVIASGELSIINSDALRRSVADWPTHMRNVQTTQMQDYEFFRDVWMPYLRKHGYLPQLSVIDAPMPSRTDVYGAIIDMPLSKSISHTGMLHDREFQNLLAQKWWIQYDILIWFERTLEMLDETILQIREAMH